MIWMDRRRFRRTKRAGFGGSQGNRGALFMNQFLEACRATGPLLLGVESPEALENEARAFDLPFVIAGRDPRADLRLNASDVSDRHAYFQIVGGQFVCVDLGSRIGVYHGGKCRRISYVERDQAVRIGPYRIRLLAGDALPEAHPAGTDDRQTASVELSHRSVRRSRCPLPIGLSLVGSAADCAIRLIDPSVSNYHCSLIRTPRGVWLVDLLGQGGVRVNGQEVGYARLYDGDEVQVGHSVLRPHGLSDETPVAVPVTPEPPSLTNEVARNGLAAVASAAKTPSRSTRIVAGPDDDGPNSTSLPIEQTSALVERIVGPLVAQVGLIQQQMVEELNQARAMMFETFAALHQEQAAFLNHELEQLRQLSQELHGLRADLERQTRFLAERTTTPPALPAARLGSAASASTTRIVAAGFTLPTASPVAQKIPNGPIRIVGPARTTTRPNGSAQGPLVSFTRSEPEVDESDAVNIHALLCDRISRINQDQQTRWQKILSVLPGAWQEKAAL